MNPALETLLLAIATDEALAVPQAALFIGAEAHPTLSAWPEITGWQPFKPLATTWDQAGFNRCEMIPDQKWPLVIVLPGKARDETFAWFAMARDHLEPGGKLLISMPNTAGAGRFEKELAKATRNITSLQKHKCRAFQTTLDDSWDESIFNEWRDLGTPRQIPQTAFTVEAGIFSSDHIDPGSQLLADHLPAHWHGDLADLGAGWGFLTDAILKRCPKVARIDLYEADSRALACARKNLAAHPQEIGYHWHDVTTGLPRSYDAIVMNPPFHIGQATHVDLGRVFLKTAADSLKRGGKLIMVANRQLPYEAVLEANGLLWRKVVEDKVYKILSAEKR